MSKKFSGDKDKSDTDRSLLDRFIEGVIVFFISALFIKISIGYILSVRLPLLIIVGVATIITVLYRIHKWKGRHDDY